MMVAGLAWCSGRDQVGGNHIISLNAFPGCISLEKSPFVLSESYVAHDKTILGVSRRALFLDSEQSNTLKVTQINRTVSGAWS